MQNFMSSHNAPLITVKPYLRRWVYGLSLILASWLGASLLLDLVIMPELATEGMMNSSSFIPTGFSLFHRFNALEIVASSLLLAGGLVLVEQEQIWHRTRFLVAAIALFVIPVVYFYYLVPQMASLGISLDAFATLTVPPTMNAMHSTYWILDGFKLLFGGLYLSELWSVLNPSQSGSAV